MHLNEVLWPNKYMLGTLGLWPSRTESTRARRLFTHLRFVVGLSAVISLLIPEIITVAIHWGDIEILGDLGSLIVLHFLLTLKILYYVVRRQSLRSAYQHVKAFWTISEDPRERRHYEEQANLAKLVTIACFMAGIVDLLSFDAAPLINYLQSHDDDNESLRHRPLFLELSYGFDTQRTPTYELVFVWQTLSSLCVISALAGCDCTMMVFIVHVSGQFRLIGARFRVFGRTISERTADREVRVGIGRLIAQHQRTIGAAQEMITLLSPVVFGQMVTSGLGICLCGYALIEGNGHPAEIAKFLVLLVGLLMELIVWCAPAELLIQQSSAVAEAIYEDVPWFRISSSLQRDLRFVMMRAQKACRVTALHRIMYLARITEVFNAAGSYMALLQSMKK